MEARLTKKPAFTGIMCMVVYGLIASAAVLSLSPGGSKADAATRTVTDMAGRKVSIPGTINRIATVGSIPVINGFVFALRDGAKLVNGLPDFASIPRWKYQTVIAPEMAGKPRMQTSDRLPNIEELLKAAPDVVFTMDKPTLPTYERANLNAVYLSWTQPEDVKIAIALMGEVLNKQMPAKAYVEYFDDTLKKVRTSFDRISVDKRARVFYGTLSPSLSNPHLISEWWIAAAGGVSVTKDVHATEAITINAEQLVVWNPQVILLSNPGDLRVAYSDTRYAQLSAVTNKRVYVTPVGVHLWGNRNIEQPLTVLWTAKTLYPGLFKGLDIRAEVKNFYSRIFGFNLTDTQVDEILSGNITSY
jgi:iron complex transport system substrate-binding protein